jgi:hypothetical protein
VEWVEEWVEEWVQEWGSRICIRSVLEWQFLDRSFLLDCSLLCTSPQRRLGARPGACFGAERGYRRR